MKKTMKTMLLLKNEHDSILAEEWQVREVAHLSPYNALLFPNLPPTQDTLKNIGKSLQELHDLSEPNLDAVRELLNNRNFDRNVEIEAAGDRPRHRSIAAWDSYHGAYDLAKRDKHLVYEYFTGKKWEVLWLREDDILRITVDSETPLRRAPGYSLWSYAVVYRILHIPGHYTIQPGEIYLLGVYPPSHEGMYPSGRIIDFEEREKLRYESYS